MWNDRLTLRGGVGYEKSPITDDVRMPLLPDNDRLGVGRRKLQSLRPYTSTSPIRICVKDTPINFVAAGNPSFTGFPYVGSVDAHVDIISVGL